jgi:hypothetical protein
MAVAEGFEPSDGRINNAVPYQLGYATKVFQPQRCTRSTNEKTRSELVPCVLFVAYEFGARGEI